MEKKEIYNPFDTKDYEIIEKDGKKFFNFNGLELELAPGGYIPKSGLIYDMVLSKEECEGKSVLDLGCGYLGILGVTAYMRGASKVDSIDYDNACVEWFNKLIKDKELNGVRCYHSNLFKNVKEEKYDMILSNPPQMPMIEGDVHDTGGLDGRDSIMDILTNSVKYLNYGGSLYLLVFDFLGLDERMNDNESLFEIASRLGFTDTKIIYSVKKIIKPNSVTAQSIPYINTIYPKYEFKDLGGGKKYCNILIAKFTK